MDYGVPLGRRFRSLKLWFVLRYFGWNGLADRLRDHLRLAKLLAEWIEAHPSFELLAPVHFGTVCFRAHPAGIDDENALNTLNEHLLQAVNKRRETFLSHTKLAGKYTIRIAIGHIQTQESHVRSTWELIQRELKELRA
jgi:aromatic-L-amino-acid decarboxylase